MHECVVSAKSLHDEVGLSALDVAKRLMELGFHPPTVYFPSSSRRPSWWSRPRREPQTLSALADAFLQVARESREAGNADEAKAARGPHQCGESTM